MSQIREMQVERMLSQAPLYNTVICLIESSYWLPAQQKACQRSWGAFKRKSNSGLEIFVPTSPACLSTTKKLVEKGRDRGEELKKRPHPLSSHDQAAQGWKMRVNLDMR